MKPLRLLRTNTIHTNVLFLESVFLPAVTLINCFKWPCAFSKHHKYTRQPSESFLEHIVGNFCITSLRKTYTGLNKKYQNTLRLEFQSLKLRNFVIQLFISYKYSVQMFFVFAIQLKKVLTQEWWYIRSFIDFFTQWHKRPKPKDQHWNICHWLKATGIYSLSIAGLLRNFIFIS